MSRSRWSLLWVAYEKWKPNRSGIRFELRARGGAPPWGPPWGPFPGKKCRENFFPPSRPWGPHGAPFPGKKFSRLSRENFLPPSRPWGPHGAPDLWSICLIYIEICSFSWTIRFRHRFKRVLWLKYLLSKILITSIFQKIQFFLIFKNRLGSLGVNSDDFCFNLF